MFVADVEQQVAAVKRDIAEAQRHRASAEHQYQVAMAQAQAAARDLKEEFGVGSVAEARALDETLEEQLGAECRTVREALARAGQGDDR